MQLALSQIKVDAGRFQFRAAEFNEQRVQWLVANWNPAIVDPLDVWDCDGEYYLLSGHHRYNAALRLGVQSLECRTHRLTLEDARAFALKSNATRLEYTDFEWCRCVRFLVEVQGRTMAEAADELALTVGTARKVYGLRHLIGTDWERYYDDWDLWGAASEVGQLCESEVKAGRPLSTGEINSLCTVVIEQDVTMQQFKGILKRLKDERGKPQQANLGTLFDMGEFTNSVIRSVKAQAHLESCAAQTWWLWELSQRKDHELPPDLAADLDAVLRRFYAYCVDSDDPNIIPKRGKRSVRAA